MFSYYTYCELIVVDRLTVLCQLSQCRLERERLTKEKKRRTIKEKLLKRELEKVEEKLSTEIEADLNARSEFKKTQETLKEALENKGKSVSQVRFLSPIYFSCMEFGIFFFCNLNVGR